MKHKGSISDFSAQRDAELHRVFAVQLANPAVRDNATLYSNVVKSPCSRFWVSEIRAAEVVSAIRKGTVPSNMHFEKRRMYDEIATRVDVILKRNPSMPLSRAVESVVWSPAPEFYLAAESARKMIRRILREMKERRGR